MMPRQLIKSIKSDLYRYCGQEGSSIARNVLLGAPGFKYSFWLRICAFLKGRRVRTPASLIANRFLKHYMYKFGISIPPETEIGCGFYIGHFGGITINPLVTIGKNCNIHQEVTLGQKNRGKMEGCPTIGDNVWIGPGAKIIGSVKVGDNVVIGANCVVCKDVPNNAVVAGIPGRVISYDGSTNYVNKTDYHFE